MRKLWYRTAALAAGAAVFFTGGTIRSDAVNLMGVGVASVMENTQLTEEELIALAEDAKEDLFGYTNLGIAKVEGNLNVRAEGSTSAKIVGKMQNESVCEILEVLDNGWAHIQSGEVEGYVSAEYLIAGPDARILVKELARTVCVASVNKLNVRKEPNTDSQIIDKVLKGETLEYIETLDDGWVKISLDGEEAYVSGEYVEITQSLKTAMTMVEVLYGQGISDVRADLCEYAKQFLGNPYVWGGTSLTNGCDCSGFVQSIYKKYGVKLTHYSGAQANEGTKISVSDIEPGDLLFYGSSASNISHVAIYIGGGKIIHASSPTTGIIISKYNYRTPVKAVRVLYE